MNSNKKKSNPIRFSTSFQEIRKFPLLLFALDIYSGTCQKSSFPRGGIWPCSKPNTDMQTETAAWMVAEWKTNGEDNLAAIIWRGEGIEKRPFLVFVSKRTVICENTYFSLPQSGILEVPHNTLATATLAVDWLALYTADCTNRCTLQPPIQNKQPIVLIPIEAVRP